MIFESEFYPSRKCLSENFTDEREKLKTKAKLMKEQLITQSAKVWPEAKFNSPRARVIESLKKQPNALVDS